MHESPAGPVPVLITLGSNITPEANLIRAVWMLGQNHHLVVRAASRVYASPPLNAAGQVDPDQPGAPPNPISLPSGARYVIFRTPLSYGSRLAGSRPRSAIWAM